VALAGVAGMALEAAPAEMTSFLHVADEGFDGGAAPELALGDARTCRAA
jgi:hypothetical protein